MLSKRERNIAILVAVAAGIFVLDRALLTPLLTSREQLSIKRQALQKQVDEGRRLLGASRAADRRFRDYRNAGLSTDASRIEGELLNALRTWSQDARLTLSSIRPDRASASHDLQELTFQASGEGSMASVRSFLYRIETGPLPLRVRELQLAARTEATDDLAVQLRVSTLWERPAPPPGDAAAAAARQPERSLP